MDHLFATVFCNIFKARHELLLREILLLFLPGFISLKQTHLVHTIFTRLTRKGLQPRSASLLINNNQFMKEKKNFVVLLQKCRNILCSLPLRVRAHISCEKKLYGGVCSGK